MATLCAAQPCLVASGGVPLRRRRTETHPSPFPTRIDSFPFAPERLAGLGAMPPPATVAAAKAPMLAPNTRSGWMPSYCKVFAIATSTMQIAGWV